MKLSTREKNRIKDLLNKELLGIPLNHKDRRFLDEYNEELERSNLKN